MGRIKYIIVLLLFSVNYGFGQVFEGYITDPSGVPVNASTVYIPEKRQGLICNSEGRFRIVLDQGSYTLQCSFPGYRDSTYIVDIEDTETIKREFILIKDSLHTENNAQADRIIENCRIKSPYYFAAAKWYETRAYQKGELVLKNVHTLINKAALKLSNFDISELKDKQALQETIIETEYFYPNSYKINDIASIGSIPDELIKKGITMIQRGSVYSGRIGFFISPLAANSSDFYRFRYKGYYISGNSKYHLIEIEPKMKDPELVGGYLYIEDTTYSVHYAILNSNQQGVEMQTTIAYKKIQGDIFLPVTYYNEVLLETIGIKGDLKYYTSIEYKDISQDEVNEDIIYTDEEDINILPDRKDKAYWDINRLQPLVVDTIKQVPDSIYFSKDNIDLSKLLLGKLILGDYIVGDGAAPFSLRYNGLKMIFRDYNYVDGFWLGNKFDLKMKFQNKRTIEAYPYIYYITGRNRIVGGSDISYNYNRRRKGKLTLTFGSRSDDFNNLSMTRYQNYFASLVMGENYNFFYQRDFASVSNSIHIDKKVRVSTSFGVEKRSGLTNHTDFNLLGRNHIKPNMFPDDRFDRTYYSVGLSYSPRSNYSITEALDMYAKRITPVFNIEYQEGFSSWQRNNSKYRKLKGGMSHNIQLNYFNWIDYKIESGVFIGKDRGMHFTDYQHFGASDLLLNLSSIFDSFLLLDNYELQTNRYWVNLFLNYSGKYLILKWIPFLQGKPFTENLHIKTLFTPDVKSYIETGYSISFNRYFGIGVFNSFHNAKGKKIGVRFSLNLRSLSFF